MSHKGEKRKMWGVIEDWLRDIVWPSCAYQAQRYRDQNEVSYVEASFEKCAAETVCDEFMAGLDFRCGNKARDILYDKRKEIWLNLNLWFRADPDEGTGLIVTSEGLDGTWWYQEEKLINEGRWNLMAASSWRKTADLRPSIRKTCLAEAKKCEDRALAAERERARIADKVKTIKQLRPGELDEWSGKEPQ